MQKIVLTNEGFNLLNQNHSEGQSQYWIGYYGLAYVPEGSALSANMTTLTPDGGDNIYNVFQGSMTTAKAGIDTDISDTAAYNLANECMYSANVMSRFRYVLDDNDNNQLVIFADNRDLATAGAENLAAGLVEYAILRNEDEEHVTVVGENDTGYGITKVDTLPLPAPLYYGGEPKNYSALDATLADTVTHDTRSYSSSNHALAQGYDVGTPGIDGEAPTSADKFDYVASRGNTFSDDVTNVDDAILDKSWQLQSVSNFNRFHAPTNAEGYRQDYEPACRNMAKVTKLFPIDHYDVISTTESNTNKVATVKYTVNVDLRNSLNAISNRSTPYYRMQNGTLSEVSASNYKAGFKFNRIGIYAVQTALHAYNTEEDAQEDCTKHHLQMQVIGDSDPVLVAVMDLATPIVLSEDGICEYSFDFQINFVKPESQIIDDAAIYYNLYEDDAITWYKNQLIANASTAEAVTSIGVQMAYLRQQINQYTGAGTSSCGIVDEDNRYALEGHTHPYMKNIVDSVLPGNGAVRGIDTLPEDSQVVVYKRNGRALIKDDTGVHYQGDDETEVPQIIEPVTAEVGDYSMLLGEKSAAMGALSLNLSENGILGANTSHNLLMGGKTVNDELNDHVAVENTHNSIISVDDTTEIEHMLSSVWIGSADAPNATHREIYVDHPVANTIGIGRISVYHTDRDTDRNPLYPTIADGRSIQYNILSGGIDLYGWAQYSLILNNGERGTSTAVGYADLMSALQTDDVLGGYDYVFGGLSTSGIEHSIISGVKQGVGRNIASTLSLGVSNKMMYGVKNSIIIGNGNNSGSTSRLKVAPQRTPVKIYSLDDFNEKYGTTLIPDDNHEFDNLSLTSDSKYDQAIVVGSGTLTALNKDGTTFTKNVHGVCLYISYSRYSIEGGQIVDGPGTWTAMDPITESAVTSYQTPGHDIYNMLLLGDYNNVAAKSHNTIIIGNDNAFPAITYNNCFISDADSERSSRVNNTLLNSPHGTFNNVWWIGHQQSTVTPCPNSTRVSGDDMRKADSGHFIADRWEPNKDTKFNDVFAFVGRNIRQYAFTAWYGADRMNGWDDYSLDDIYQPCKAPMIYSGGIALGGYGTPDSNFMLMKIGVRGCWTGDTGNTSRRGLDHEPNIYSPSLSAVRNIVYLEDGHPTTKADKVVNANGSFDLYDDYCADGIHHLQVDSPFAGMVLMVQDKQELDGTLHVGLGKMSGGGGFDTNDMRTVKVTSEYVSFSMRFWFEITTKDHSSLEYLDVIDPFHNSGTHTDGESILTTISSPNDDYQISYTFVYHATSNNELQSLRIVYLPKDKPVNLILNYRDSFSGVTIGKNTDNGVTMYGMETAGKLAMVTFSSEWPFVTANNEVVVNYPMFDLRETNNDNTVSMCVSTQNYVIPRPDTTNSYNTTVMLVPLEIPGYYNRSSWSHDPYPGIMRANSEYQSTDSRAEGQLPYFCRVQHVRQNRVI